jgi:hypothetical protein
VGNCVAVQTRPRFWAARFAAALSAISLFIGLAEAVAQQPSEVASSAPQGFERSLTFAVNQAVVEDLRRADELLAGDDPLAGLELLLKVQLAPASWIPDGTGFVSNGEASLRRLRKLAPHYLEAYVRLAEPLAAQGLAEARESRNPELLRGVVGTFPLTPSGERAGQQYRAVLRDQGEEFSEQMISEDSVEAGGARSPIAWPQDPIPGLAESMSPEVLGFVRERLRDAYENGRRPIIPAYGLMTATETVLSTPWGLRGFEGERKWELPNAGTTWQRPLSKSAEPELLRELFQCESWVRMEKDGHRVFRLGASTQDGRERSSFRLQAVVRGKIVWEVDPAASGVVFLGPPAF